MRPEWLASDEPSQPAGRASGFTARGRSLQWWRWYVATCKATGFVRVTPESWVAGAVRTLREFRDRAGTFETAQKPAWRHLAYFSLQCTGDMEKTSTDLV